MKLLVRKHTVSITDLWQYFQKVNPIEKSSLEKILEQMERDGFLKLRGKEIRIV